MTLADWQSHSGNAWNVAFASRIGDQRNGTPHLRRGLKLMYKTCNFGVPLFRWLAESDWIGLGIISRENLITTSIRYYKHQYICLFFVSRMVTKTLYIIKCQRYNMQVMSVRCGRILHYDNIHQDITQEECLSAYSSFHSSGLNILYTSIVIYDLTACA